MEVQTFLQQYGRLMRWNTMSYPKPDGALSFDRLSSVFLSNTNHEEYQPAQLTLKGPSVPVRINLARYVPRRHASVLAGVYEFAKQADGADQLVINQCAELRALQDV